MKLSSWCLTLTLLLCPCVMFTAPGQHRNPRRSGGSQRQSAPSRQLSATNLLDNLREALGTNAPQRVIQDLLSQINFRAMQRGSADARAASALLEEARNEHQATMLLNAGVSVWERDQAGQIPLHRVRNADVARVILGRVPNTATARDQESRTPLHTAIAHHATHMLRVLTQHANLGLKDTHGKTALHLAVAAGDADAVAVLAQSGHVVVNTPDQDGKPPIFYAKSAAIFQQLVDAGARLDDPKKPGASLLEECFVEAKQRRVIPEILVSPAFHEFRDSQHGRTVFHLAVWLNHKQAVERFKDAHLENVPDKSGKTPIFFVHSFQILEQLLSMGADLAHTDAAGTTPFDALWTSADDQCIVTLLRHNALMVKKYDSVEREKLRVKLTAVIKSHIKKRHPYRDDVQEERAAELLVACFLGDVDGVKRLLDDAADVKKVLSDRWYDVWDRVEHPLTAAVGQGQLEVVRTLVTTPLHDAMHMNVDEGVKKLAEKRNFKEIAELLRTRLNEQEEARKAREEREKKEREESRSRYGYGSYLGSYGW